MRFADLHLHTIFSDGTYTPQEIIQKVSNIGIDAIAVTDHDTVEAIPPTLELGKGKGIEVIPAIELSAEYDGLEVHILGYFIEYTYKALLEKLDFLKKNREQRMYKMIEKLNQMDIALEPEEVFKLSGKGTVGRLHLARTLVRKGYVDNIYTAFQKYIGEQAPAYVCSFRFSPSEAIKLIRESKGIAVLAHPYSLRRDDLIPLFVEYGLRGLEVYYPEHSKSMTDYYKNLADKFNLLITGGSDCHGQAKPEVQLGSIKLPYTLVERLKEERIRIP